MTAHLHEEVEAYLNDLTLDLSKEVLRSPHIDLFHQSTSELYLFLYVYFQKLANRQKHERAISISPQDAQTVLSKVLAKQLQTAPKVGNRRGVGGGGTVKLAPNGNKRKEAVDGGGASKVVVQQRSVQEQLTQLHINCAAFAEVVEVSRFLDRKVGLASPPFGAVHLFHFVSAFITLCNVKRLFDLVQIVMDCVDLEHEHKTYIFYLWSLMDSANREGLDKLVATLQDHPGITAPLLLELFPGVADLHTKAGLQQAASSTVAPRIVQHSAEDEGLAALLVQGHVSTTVKHNEEGDLLDEGGADEGEDNDPETQQSPEDKEFWANLVK